MLLVLGYAGTGNALAVTPPDTMNYQGMLKDSAGNPLTGTYDMVFRFHDSESGGLAILIESHTAGLGNPVSVTEGLYDVILGTGDMADGPGVGTYTSLSEVFRDFADVWLEVQVGAETLLPRNRISSVAYSLNAAFLEGRDSTQFLGKFGQVVTVAKEGGDFTSIQDAIDSITDADYDKPYLVWIAPGVYSEQVVMASFIHLKGAGRQATWITSQAIYPSDATLKLASFSTLGNLAVENTSVTEGVAILGETSLERVEIYNVLAMTTAQTRGTALHLKDSGTEVELFDVWGFAFDSSDENRGLLVENGAMAMVQCCEFEASGGSYAYGIRLDGMDTELNCVSVESEAWDADNCYGLWVGNGARAEVDQGSFEGNSGMEVFGVYSQGQLQIKGSRISAQDGSVKTSALACFDWTRLDGGTYRAQGESGTMHTIGIEAREEAVIEAYAPVVQAEGGDNVVAVRSVDSGVRLKEGTYRAYRAMNECCGIEHSGSMGWMDLANVNVEVHEGDRVLAVQTSNTGGVLTILEGNFTSRGDSEVYGFRCQGMNSELDARRVTVRVDGNECQTMIGVACENDATASIKSSVIEVHGWNAAMASVVGIEGRTGAEIWARNNTVQAFGGDSVFGIRCENGNCDVSGGSYEAMGGQSVTCGMYVTGSTSHLLVSNLTVVAFGDGSGSWGIDSDFGAMVFATNITSKARGGDEAFALRGIDTNLKLVGGDYLAQDGVNLCCGIRAEGSGWFTATHLSSRAEHGQAINAGLSFIKAEVTGMLQDVTLAATGGMASYGIQCEDTGVTSTISLDLIDVRALGQYASDDNYGLHFLLGQSVSAQSCHFQAGMGNNAYGVYLNGDSANLRGNRVTAKAWGGLILNVGLCCVSGATARVMQGHLEGGSFSVSGSGFNSVDLMTCHLEGPVDLSSCNCAGITRENITFYSNSCGP